MSVCTFVNTLLNVYSCSSLVVGCYQNLKHEIALLLLFVHDLEVLVDDSDGEEDSSS